MKPQYEYWFNDFVEVPGTNKCYFFGANVKGFFCIDKFSGKVTLLDELKEHIYKNDMYGRGIYINGKIYFPPCKINTLAIFDVFKQKLQFVELYSDELEHKDLYYNSPYGHFILNKNDLIYIIHRQYPIMTRIDTKSGKKDFLLNKALPESFYLELGHNNNGDIWYFPHPDTNGIFEFNMGNEYFGVIKLDEFEALKISSCYHDGDKLLIVPNEDSCIYVFGLDNKICRRYEIEIDPIHSKNRNFITKFGEYYYILPLVNIGINPESDYVYKIDSEIKLIEKREIFGKYKDSNKLSLYNENGNEWFIFFDITDNNNCNIYFPNKATFARIDMDKLCIIEENITVPSGESEESMSDRVICSQLGLAVEYNDFILEDDVFSLDKFIGIL